MTPCSMRFAKNTIAYVIVGSKVFPCCDISFPLYSKTGEEREGFSVTIDKKCFYDMSTLKVNQSIRLSNGTTAVVQKEPGRGGQGIVYLVVRTVQNMPRQVNQSYIRC